MFEKFVYKNRIGWLSGRTDTWVVVGGHIPEYNTFKHDGEFYTVYYTERQTGQAPRKILEAAKVYVASNQFAGLSFQEFLRKLKVH